MSVALLVAWLVIGVGQEIWWDFGGTPVDVGVGEAGELQKMDGPYEPPPKP